MPNATTKLSSQIISPLERRGVISVAGADCASFLQGLISNDVGLATTERALFAAILTPQGKFLHDFFVLKQNDAFLLDIERSEIPHFLPILTAHKLRAKVELVDVSHAWDLWAIWGKICPEPQSGLYRDPRHPEAGWRLLLPAKSPPPSGQLVPYKDYNRHRLELGLPDGALDMEKGKSTLLEGNYDVFHGISWQKGCYMGQELTARTKYRGLVKRRLVAVHMHGTPETLIITRDGEEVGVLRSHDGNRGLALLEVSLLHAPTPMRAGTCHITLATSRTTDPDISCS